MDYVADTFVHVTMESRFPGALTPCDECPSWTVPHTPLALRGMESDIQNYAPIPASAAGCLRTRGSDLDMASTVRFGFGGDELQLEPHIEAGDFAARVFSAVASSRGIALEPCRHFDVNSLGFIDQLLLVYADDPPPSLSARALVPAHEHIFSVVFNNVDHM